MSIECSLGVRRTDSPLFSAVWDQLAGCICPVMLLKMVLI